MASLAKQAYTVSVDAGGKRVPPGTPGSRKVTKLSAKWYACDVPGHPPGKRIPLCRDKLAAKRMLDDMVRAAEQGRAGLPARDAHRRPLADYLAGFAADVAVGLASKGGRKRKPPSPEQAALVVQRVRDVLDGCGFQYPTDLDGEAAGKLARHLQARTRLARKDGGLSAQTATFFVADARRFVRWLSGRAAVRPDLFDPVPGFDPKADRKHARRNFTPEELARLLDAAANSPLTIRGLTGRDRYFLYLTAFATGYRAGELAALEPSHFVLDGDDPAVFLPARLTKNGKTARQPVPPGVAARLREYLSGRPKTGPVWPGTWSEAPVKVLRRDLKAAGVPYVVAGLDGPEYADFHSLRHSFISALAATGVGAAELQKLARHSDPRLTLGRYTHTSAAQLATAVNRLALPGADGEVPAALTREQLEAVAGLAAAVLGWAFGPAGVSGGVSKDAWGAKRPRK